VGTDIDEDVGHAHSEALGVGKVDGLIGGMSVGLGSEETESNDEGVGVETTELGEERNRSSHAVASVVFTVVEVLGSGVDRIVEPRSGVLHAPSISIVVTLDFNLAVVGHISRQLGSDSLGSNLSIHVGRQTHAESEGG
jgi:hypothetical protein